MIIIVETDVNRSPHSTCHNGIQLTQLLTRIRRRKSCTKPCLTVIYMPRSKLPPPASLTRKSLVPKHDNGPENQPDRNAQRQSLNPQSYSINQPPRVLYPRRHPPRHLARPVISALRCQNRGRHRPGPVVASRCVRLH